jgi:hypothetical protein
MAIKPETAYDYKHGTNHICTPRVWCRIGELGWKKGFYGCDVYYYDERGQYTGCSSCQSFFFRQQAMCHGMRMVVEDYDKRGEAVRVPLFYRRPLNPLAVFAVGVTLFFIALYVFVFVYSKTP